MQVTVLRMRVLDVRPLRKIPRIDVPVTAHSGTHEQVIRHGPHAGSPDVASAAAAVQLVQRTGCDGRHLRTQPLLTANPDRKHDQNQTGRQHEQRPLVDQTPAGIDHQAGEHTARHRQDAAARAGQQDREHDDRHPARQQQGNRGIRTPPLRKGRKPITPTGATDQLVPQPPDQRPQPQR